MFEYHLLAITWTTKSSLLTPSTFWPDLIALQEDASIGLFRQHILLPNTLTCLERQAAQPFDLGTQTIWGLCQVMQVVELPTSTTLWPDSLA